MVWWLDGLMDGMMVCMTTVKELLMPLSGTEKLQKIYNFEKESYVGTQTES